MKKDAQTQKSPDLNTKNANYSEPITTVKPISFNLLEIPAELAFIYSKIDSIYTFFIYI